VIALARLADVLATQLADHSEDAVGDGAVLVGTCTELGPAVSHLKELSRDLSVAAGEADRYWGAIRTADPGTALPDRDAS
jgi:hypothetical protein